ncbi:UNVERIFIED_CONTAM: hypothetical protein GTU68_031826 [Idotea baltica]|nr:hypothetical protein [Idotea baltica]
MYAITRKLLVGNIYGQKMKAKSTKKIDLFLKKHTYRNKNQTLEPENHDLYSKTRTSCITFCNNISDRKSGNRKLRIFYSQRGLREINESLE